MNPAPERLPWFERRLVAPTARRLGLGAQPTRHPARLRRGRHIQQVTAVELAEDARPPVLDAYLTATRRRTTRQPGRLRASTTSPCFSSTAALSQISPKESRMPASPQLVEPHATSSVEPDRQRLRLTGWLLVTGALVSLCAGAIPSMYDVYLSRTPRQFLELVADRSDTWAGVHLAFLAGAVLTTLGLAALTSALADGRGRTLAGIGLALFLLATPVRVLQTIFAATVTVTAAEQTASSGVIPPAYELLEGFLWGTPNWALAAFIALTGAGLALFGAALLAARRLARWLGWTFVAGGLLLTVSVVLLGDGPPEAVELPLLFGGVLALRESRP
jgi:hypothetical protein